MPPTNYSRGRAFEYRVRDKVLGPDYRAEYVMRAAGSRTAADLAVFWNDKQVWLVQCKRDGRFNAVERAALVDLAVCTGHTPVLAKAGPKGIGVIFEELDVE